MATTGSCTFSCKGVILLISFIVLASLVLYPKHQQGNIQSANYLRKAFNFLENKDDDHHQSHYEHHWPELRFGWRIVVGTVIGFMGAAFGSVGGVGGGGIFVPMLSLIIGFDTKSSAAMSKCMITGASLSTVYYNLGQKHPSLDLPVIDYDLALLFQPMLILGISIGVDLNVILADWMITVLLIILFFVIATKAFWRGVRTWKKETIVIHEEARRVEPNGDFMDEAECEVEGEDTSDKKRKVSIVENVYWKEVGLLVGVWVIILALQIAKNHTSTCSWAYWVFNVLQIPVAVGVSSYEAVSVYKGKRKMASRGEARAEWKAWKLVFFCLCGVVGGIVGGLLGLGGGFILGPLFLDMGFPPQVSSATATFAMLFSASISVVEYYLLRRFPVPYALYLAGVAIIAALVGQYVVKKAIQILGRASIIIFILAAIIFLSATSLGGVGLARMVKNIERKSYMGFENICSYQS